MEDRIEAAVRLLRVSGFDAVMAASTHGTIRGLAWEVEPLSVARAKQAVVASIVDTMTLEQIEAAIVFYTSPAGRAWTVWQAGMTNTMKEMTDDISFSLGRNKNA